MPSKHGGLPGESSSAGRSRSSVSVHRPSRYDSSYEMTRRQPLPSYESDPIRPVDPIARPSRPPPLDIRRKPVPSLDPDAIEPIIDRRKRPAHRGPPAIQRRPDLRRALHDKHTEQLHRMDPAHQRSSLSTITDVSSRRSLGRSSHSREPIRCSEDSAPRRPEISRWSSDSSSDFVVSECDPADYVPSDEDSRSISPLSRSRSPPRRPPRSQSPPPYRPPQHLSERLPQYPVGRPAQRAGQRQSEGEESSGGCCTIL